MTSVKHDVSFTPTVDIGMFQTAGTNLRSKPEVSYKVCRNVQWYLLLTFWLLLTISVFN